MNSERPSKPSRADDEFQELLGSTGGRESVDPRRVAEIKQAIRPAWEQAVRSAAEDREGAAGTRPSTVEIHGGSARTWLAAAAILIVALSGFWALSRWSRPSGGDLRVATARGAFVLEAGERRQLVEGVVVGPGSVVVTGQGSSTFVAFVDAEGRSIRLDAAGRLVLAAEHELELLEGRVYVDHETRPGAIDGPGVSVRTALGTVREIGTQFQVELERGQRSQSLHAIVRTGRVLLEAGSHREQATAGEELVLEGDVLVRRDVDPSSDRWSWVLASAPPLDVTNATTHDVLRWVARETGRRLIYESDDLQVEMGRTAIETGRERVTVEEALAMLPAAGLEVSLEGAQLRVRDASK